MNDEQAAEVQAALDVLDSAFARRHEDVLRYHAALSTIDYGARDWLRDLLAERQRLRAIEDLAREWCSLYGLNAEAAQADVMDRLQKALGG